MVYYQAMGEKYVGSFSLCDNVLLSVLQGDIQRSTRNLQIHSCNKEMVQHLRESGIKHSF
jgi:hypothetical protein